jgi:hypothetical protein
MGSIAHKTRTPIYAWALMINHSHILLRSGPHGISDYMRKLLTGYAVSYNRKHNRHGYLFQNRYKSIMCEEEGVRESELRGGSRRRQISRIRKRIACELIERYGVPMATVAQETGVTTTAISKIMAK